ncbi:Protein kinase domain-containing protein [Mycena chlorophos]|uniref:Protein kinase domain-containing protein n=1 Tax=Mycena chlorophos TaxID=658473 RepID=A0A8H6WBL4_MYCCL|nr:Protein kinase domain-containing protein [Mycena chlorophos]
MEQIVRRARQQPPRVKFAADYENSSQCASPSTWPRNTQESDTNTFTKIIPWPYAVDYDIDENDLMDATRSTDGLKVVLKRIRASTQELGIIRFLNSPELLRDPNNKTCPLLDVIPLADNEVILVMPILRVFDSPIFRHLQEGLVFMHAHHIQHGDACRMNLMMDASQVIPEGYHFHADWAEEQNLGQHYRWRDRCSVRPVRYYFIDFGLSAYHPHGPGSASQLAVRSIWPGQKLDVYQLGNVFLEVLAAFPAHQAPLQPILQSMTRTDPSMRPTASEALKEFEALCLRIPAAELTVSMEYEPDSDPEDDLRYEIL